MKVDPPMRGERGMEGPDHVCEAYRAGQGAFLIHCEGPAQGGVGLGNPCLCPLRFPGACQSVGSSGFRTQATPPDRHRTDGGGLAPAGRVPNFNWRGRRHTNDPGGHSPLLRLRWGQVRPGVRRQARTGIAVGEAHWRGVGGRDRSPSPSSGGCCCGGATVGMSCLFWPMAVGGATRTSRRGHPSPPPLAPVRQLRARLAGC